MRVIYRGQKPSWMPLFQEAVKFACQKLELDEKDIKIEFLFFKPSGFGPINGQFCHYKNVPYKIEIEKCLNGADAILTVFHELVHWQQCIKGAFNQGNQTWYGKKFSRANKLKDYLDLPWEVEARSMAKTMAEEWITCRNNQNKK